MRPSLQFTTKNFNSFSAKPHNLGLQNAIRCMDAHRLYTYQTTIPSHQQPPNMSLITLSDLRYITREDLSSKLLSSSATATAAPHTPDQLPASDASNSDSAPLALPPNLAIIDVRDNDHIGGHIKGSTWVPSSTLDYRIPELIRTLKDKEIVVFHCALSQQRGPSAALRYLREKGRLEGKSEEKVVGKDGEGDGESGKKKEQKVLVLDGGFVKWQEKYGPDKRLTEAWQKYVWEFGY